MKNFLFVIGLLTFQSTAKAQEFTTYTWENGKTKAEGRLIQGGIEEGEWKYYNQAGLLIQKANYTFGVIDGEYEHYFENGKLSEKGSFKDSKRNNSFQTYYESGSANLSGFYNNGYKDSLWINFHENGNKKWKGKYVSDIRIGRWQHWYDNGQTKKTVNYDNGERTTTYKSRDGEELVSEGNGDWVEYGMDNKVKSNGSFKGGERHGIWKAFYDNGQIASIETYIKNENDGSLDK
jgi:antitoxin component YwqK of YwqJK toxin-antitoxin module